MSILCVGSVALDTVETPFGSAERVLGGSAVFFGAAASLLNRGDLVRMQIRRGRSIVYIAFFL